MITPQQLIKWAPGSAKVAESVTGWFNKYAEYYAVNTPLRIAAFLSQTIHESASFMALREYASGKAYEGRKDLGNIYPGDGARYKGRGYIQITGRNNYAAVSKSFFPDAPGTLLINPDLLATPQYGMQSAFWFWNREGLNKYADEQYIETITKRINGGLNGFDDRVHYYNVIGGDLGIQAYIITS